MRSTQKTELLLDKRKRKANWWMQEGENQLLDDEKKNQTINKHA